MKFIIKWVFWLVVPYVILFFFWPIAFLPSYYHASFSFKKSVKLGFIALLVSPFVLIPVFSFSSGMVGYFTGNAHLRYYGLPGAEFFNLHPELRCYKSTSGCIVNGSEIFTQTPNNAAIRMFAGYFGPMKGTYQGPYPLRDEVFQILTSAKSMPFDIGKKEAKTQKTPIPEKILLSEKVIGIKDLRYSLYRDSCLIIGNRFYAELYDYVTGRKFAVYINLNSKYYDEEPIPSSAINSRS
jgi:hypothetical protein